MDEGSSLAVNDSNLNIKRRCKTNCVADGPNKTSCTNTGNSLHHCPKESAIQKQLGNLSTSL